LLNKLLPYDKEHKNMVTAKYLKKQVAKRNNIENIENYKASKRSFANAFEKMSSNRRLF